jgi:fatty-acyl-CoA synthase
METAERALSAGDPVEAPLFDSIDAWAAQQPDAVALIDGGRDVRVGELAEESRKIAAALSSIGLQKGDRVAIWLPNSARWVAIFLACTRIGAIAVLTNTRFRTAEMSVLLRRTRPRALFYDSGAKGASPVAILDQLDQENRSSIEFAIDTACRNGRPELAAISSLSYDGFLGSDQIVRTGDHRDDLCLLFSTSGTTSEPKFVAHTNGSIARHAMDVARRFDLFGSRAVMLQILPLCGTFGLSQMAAALVSKRPTVMRETFDPEVAAADIGRFEVSHLCGTNDAIAGIAASLPAGSLPRTDGLWGFAEFNPALKDLPERLSQRGLRLVGLYGSSELQALFASQDPQAPVAERARAGGFPASAQSRVRVRDVTTGELCGPGSLGLLEFRGPSMMRGYFDAPDLTAQALTDDGYFRSGDLGELQEDGSFVFKSRAGEFLRLKGFLVHPSEIEDQIRRHDDVEACQVVEAPSPAGAVPVAFVIIKPGGTFDEAALQAWCSKNLAHFKVPQRFVELSVFPAVTSANGTKIQRGELRALAVKLQQNGGQ